MTSLFREDLSSIPAYVPGCTIPGAIKIASNEVTDGPGAGRPRCGDGSRQRLQPLPGHLPPRNYELPSPTPSTETSKPKHEHRQPHHPPRLWSATAPSPYSNTSSKPPAPPAPCGHGVAQLRGLPHHWAMWPSEPRTGSHLPTASMTWTPWRKPPKTPTPALCCLCNPNNPTRETFSHIDLVEFLQKSPVPSWWHLTRPTTTTTGGTFPHSVELLSAYPNLVVLRTFSKAYGLAGLRVGHPVGSEETCRELSKVVIPFATGLAAQAAAVAALTLRDQLLARTDTIVEERQRVTQALRTMGFEVHNSEANFVWLPRTDAQQLTDYLTEQKILVRGFVGDGIRVTISTPAENDQFLDAIAGYPPFNAKPDRLAGEQTTRR
ncbi:MAG: aminotransferase class I/II-fold pyridoxal phosphate-dependent enzyme [Lawsonella clevelandensis]